METILVFIGILVGILSGFFGIGGGMILIPLLMLFGIDIKTAIGISIVQMLFSSIYGSYLNYKKGTLVLGEGLFVGLGGFVGGYLSGYISPYVPDRILQAVFVAFVVFALVRMVFSGIHGDDAESKTLPMPLLFVIGTGIGIVAISIGVGGAIVLIPVLSGLLHYPVKKAVSAGLFFVVFSSVAGLIGRLMHGEIDLINGSIVGIGSLAGVWVGIWLKEHVSSRGHKNFILVMYGVILMIMVYKMYAG